MALRNPGFFATAIIATAVLLLGCAGQGVPESGDNTVSPGITQGNSTLQVGVSQPGSNPHAVWGIWWMYIDPDEPSWEIIPARTSALHVNVRKFLEDGVPCTDCLSITGLVSNPDGTKSVDIQITHPWPGHDTYTGFDVRGIAMWNGSEVWPASGLRTQDPYGTDGCVLNADGFTTVFNPTDFPPGSDMPILTYTRGAFATPTFPDSTLNPYKEYYTDQNRHLFRAGESNTRTWEIRFPTVGPIVLGYAVDASWAAPDVDPPVNIPDDFTIHANMPEPYIVQTRQQNPLEPEIGSEVNIIVKVYDWQKNAVGIWVECPELWSGKKNDLMAAHSDLFVEYYVPITNETGAPEGTYRALVAARDSMTTMPPWDHTTYQFFDITVGGENLPPVAAAAAEQYTTYTGEPLQFTSLSVDPNGPGDIVEWEWDFENDDVWDSNEADPIWIYYDPGTYLVDHRVTDSGMLSDDLEPDEHLAITVIDFCCQYPPVAIMDVPTDVVTDETYVFTSYSYDPEGEECPVYSEWDLNGDGLYDDGTGTQVSVSFDEIGVYPVGLRAIDVCGLVGETNSNVIAHVGVTQPEDEAYKTVGTRYSYVSADLIAPDYSSEVDLNSQAGHWDFTLLPLTDVGNHRAILGYDHPEVDAFKDDFVFPYDHFYKTAGIYNIVSGAVYVAELFATDPDRLLWVGIHEDADIGSVNLAPPVEHLYPLWINSVVAYYYGVPPLFEFHYYLNGWGEGTVSVPYGGIIDEPCFVTKYEIVLVSPSVSGSALVYEWYIDDGTVVAIVAAINTASETNYGPDSGIIFGTATYNALSDVGPY